MKLNKWIKSFELNKQCGMILGWGYVGYPYCGFPVDDIPAHIKQKFFLRNKNQIIKLKSLHFHDSYDFSMLLLKEFMKTERFKVFASACDIWGGSNYLLKLLEMEPLQISLELLENLSKNKHGNHQINPGG